jgi:hypothetical protein
MWDDGTPGGTSTGGKTRGILIIFFRMFLVETPNGIASDVHRPCPPFAKENTF